MIFSGKSITHFLCHFLIKLHHPTTCICQHALHIVKMESICHIDHMESAHLPNLHSCLQLSYLHCLLLLLRYHQQLRFHFHLRTILELRICKVSWMNSSTPLLRVVEDDTTEEGLQEQHLGCKDSDLMTVLMEDTTFQLEKKTSWKNQTQRRAM